MWWFIRTSYSYINPRGVRQHIRFLRDLPGAYRRYAKCMRKAELDGDGGV